MENYIERELKILVSKEQFDAIKQLIESKSNDSMLQKQNSILIKYMSNSFSNFQEAKEELSQMFQ